MWTQLATKERPPAELPINAIPGFASVPNSSSIPPAAMHTNHLAHWAVSGVRRDADTFVTKSISFGGSATRLTEHLIPLESSRYA